jgi:hypothetical protein
VVSRQDRQRQQIARALERRRFALVLVLCREHLVEFPDDLEVRAAAERAHHAVPREDREP